MNPAQEGPRASPATHPAHSASPATPKLAGLEEDVAEPRSLDVGVSSLLQRSSAAPRDAVGGAVQPRAGSKAYVRPQ